MVFRASGTAFWLARGAGSRAIGGAECGHAQTFNDAPISARQTSASCCCAERTCQRNATRDVRLSPRETTRLHETRIDQAALTNELNVLELDEDEKIMRSER